MILVSARSPKAAFALEHQFRHFLGLRKAFLLVRAPFFFLVGSLLPVTAPAVGIEPLAASVFRIEVQNSDGHVSTGSAVMVARHSLVTSCHVVRDMHRIEVVEAKDRFPTRVVRGDFERDLCLLEVPDLEGSPAALGSTVDKLVGESITALGYPTGGPLTSGSGHIEGLFRYDGVGRVIQGSASFSPGASGGGLFDKNGSLVGVLTFKCRAGGPYHFSVPVEWVKALMTDTLRTEHATTSMPFWQHTGERQPIFVRAAALSADDNCGGLEVLASQWLVREPGNPEALLMVERARDCSARMKNPSQHSISSRVLSALGF